MDTVNNIIDTTLNSFDFTFCIIVNLLTYFAIHIAGDIKKKCHPLTKSNKLSVWDKRLILFVVISLTGGTYYLIGADVKLLINSAILAPVFWSWVMKPVCKTFGIDYKEINILK